MMMSSIDDDRKSGNDGDNDDNEIDVDDDKHDIKDDDKHDIKDDDDNMLIMMVLIISMMIYYWKGHLHRTFILRNLVSTILEAIVSSIMFSRKQD